MEILRQFIVDIELRCCVTDTYENIFLVITLFIYYFRELMEARFKFCLCILERKTFDSVWIEASRLPPPVLD